MRATLIAFGSSLICCTAFYNNPSTYTDSLTPNLEHSSLGSINNILKNEISNPDFSNAPLGVFNFYGMDFSRYFSGDFEISKALIKNEYLDQMDTVINISRGSSLVRFYNTNGKTYLDSLFVNSSGFVKFQYGIDIGMSKHDFLTAFIVSNECYADSIAVSNEENGIVNFLFINGKLDNIQIFPW